MPEDEELYVDTRTAQLQRHSGLTRAQVLKLGAALPVALGIGRFASAATAAVRDTAPTPIVKPLPPDWFVKLGTNAEMRWDALQGEGYVVPNSRFFVRDHTATPLVDAQNWQLRVVGSGLKGDGASFTYEQLRKLPSRELTAFIECAGNGRSFFASQQGTPAPGSQWGLGAIGVAKWKGVRLSEVLERAGITKSAVDVMPQGLDGNVVVNGVDYGQVRRPLPVAKALDDALLAYEMNGVPLPPDHGFPLRLVVPGWVGISSIKWVGQIEVSDQPLFSLWNTQQYRLLGTGYPADSPPLTSQVVKSAWELARGASSALPAARQAHRPRVVGDERDQERGRQHRPRRNLEPGEALRPQPGRRMGAVLVLVPAAAERDLRAVGPRHRCERPYTARHGAVQQSRLSLRRHRPASRRDPLMRAGRLFVSQRGDRIEA
jgi:DMSO/TMAO reductase YedYZ molybdopterin-dependent catalytic subunit